eukprot:TRINITY_DN40814_c0_g1_i1.p1 TRINITY_DN40814_c0_g1~~TRINITY_DN40814_c0_g1_i1.p1  ORF type:complete len:592 (+),score=72.08 TRINITY_DN40814_c0_g1_i1:161-1936(+)
MDFKGSFVPRGSVGGDDTRRRRGAVFAAITNTGGRIRKRKALATKSRLSTFDEDDEVLAALMSGSEDEDEENGESTYFRVADIDAELSLLRPFLQECHDRCRQTKEDIKQARSTEIQERNNLWKRQVEMDKRLVQLVVRIQRTFRGMRARRMLMKTLQLDQAKLASWASSLPKQLATHLHDMRITVHCLRYRPIHCQIAAEKIRDWWRVILLRRGAVVLKIASWLHHTHSKLSASAVKVQCRIRSRITRRKFLATLHAKMRETRQQQLQEMIQGNRYVVFIQRAMRAKLSQRRIEDARLEIGLPKGFAVIAVEDKEAEVPVAPSYIDTWSPTCARGRRLLSKSVPPRDVALTDLEVAGCRPFNLVAANQSMRHRIGGAANAVPSMTDFALATVVDTSALEEWASSQNPWEVYPSGTSAGFAKNLDVDAWPRDAWDSARPGTCRPQSLGASRLAIKPTKRTSRLVTRPVTSPTEETSNVAASDYAPTPRRRRPRACGKPKKGGHTHVKDASLHAVGQVVQEEHPLLTLPRSLPLISVESTLSQTSTPVGAPMATAARSGRQRSRFVQTSREFLLPRDMIGPVAPTCAAFSKC